MILPAIRGKPSCSAMMQNFSIKVSVFTLLPRLPKRPER